jgi:hypothetical protein
VGGEQQQAQQQGHASTARHLCCTGFDLGIELLHGRKRTMSQPRASSQLPLLIDAIGSAPCSRRREPPAALTHQSAMALYLACADE